MKPVQHRIHAPHRRRRRADYTQAIQLDPKSAATYAARGFAYQNKGDNDRAIADYTQAVKLDPKNARETGVDKMLAQLQKSQAQTALRGQSPPSIVQKTPPLSTPLDINKQAIDSIGGLTTVLGGITDLASARAALPKLQAAKAELDRINDKAGPLSAERRKALASVVLPRIPALDQLYTKVRAVSGVSDELKPTIDDLKAKFAASPVDTASTEVDWPKLRMAQTVRTYVERCENRSAPG